MKSREEMEQYVASRIAETINRRQLIGAMRASISRIVPAAIKISADETRNAVVIEVPFQSDPDVVTEMANFLLNTDVFRKAVISILTDAVETAEIRRQGAFITFIRNECRVTDGDAAEAAAAIEAAATPTRSDGA